MKTTVSLVSAWAALSALGPQESDEELIALGKKVFRQSCSRCHFVPDPDIERDKIWTELVNVTA